MKPITEFVTNDLYPKLFSCIDSAFPSMRFQLYNGGWRSRYKLDGSESHDHRMDKTIISRKKPHLALEQGGESIDLITLYKNINGINTDIEAIKALANVCRLELPQMDSASYQAYKNRQEAIEKIVIQMKKDLLSSSGSAALDYLYGRGYDKKFIEESEFGFVSKATADSLRPLFTYTNREGQEVCSIPNGIGDKYVVAIPYRYTNTIGGLVFRAIDNDVTPKYKDAFISSNASKRYHLFGMLGFKLTGNKDTDKDIVVVEGEIDALRCQYHGIKNVVAASGGNISNEAIEEAKKIGVHRVCLLFDTEATEESQNNTNNKIIRAIKSINKSGLTAMVASLPQPEKGVKVDADSYLKDHTGRELQFIINNALSAPLWLFEKDILARAIIRQGGEGEPCTCANLDEMMRETIELATSDYCTPTDRAAIFKYFEKSTGGYITADDIQAYADQKLAEANKKKQEEEALKLSAEFSRLVEEGRINDAIAMMGKESKKLQSIAQEAEFSKLLVRPSRKDIMKRWATKPEGIKTDYWFGQGDQEQRLVLPSGALTYVCGATSHGKSVFLQNLAIQCVKDAQEGSTLYFSFEENADAICLKLLNNYIGMPLNQGRNIDALRHYYKEQENGNVKGMVRYFSRDYKDASGNPNGTKYQEFQKAEDEFWTLIESGKLSIYYEDYDSDKLCAAIKSICNKEKVKAIFVDYVQLMDKSSFNGFSRKDELKLICEDLMKLSVSLRIPVVLAAQLNREALSPIEMTLQNIADASNIEHSANIAIMLWNSIVKPQPKSQWYTKRNGENVPSEEAQALINRGWTMGIGGQILATLEKNRDGVRGINTILNFDGNTGRITDRGNHVKDEAIKENIPQPKQTIMDFRNPLREDNETDAPF